MKKFKEHFSGPSHPSTRPPVHPSNPSHQTRPSASLCRCSHWTPEGHCRYTGSFVPFSLQTHKNVVYDFQNYTAYVCFKSELLDPKNQLPAVMLKFLSTTPNSMIFKITTRTCVLKTNFYTHKKKSHVPALILKFLTTTPNLTSNFET